MTSWADAVAAAHLFAVDPAGTGVAVRAPAGVVRERWLAMVRASLPATTAMRRVPLNIADDRLLGGLDLSATLGAGRPMFSRGLLAEIGDGVLMLAMAERLSPGAAARFGAATDDGALFGIVALDEGADPDERPPAGLMDRLAFPLILDDAAPDPGEIAWEDPVGIAAARRRLPGVSVDDTVLEAICATAVALGVDSMRASVLALGAARAAAALAGRDLVSAEDAALAARLVLAPRATRMPQPMEAEAEPDAASEPEPEPDSSPTEAGDPNETSNRDETGTPDDTGNPEEGGKTLEDRVLEAAQAAIPAGLLAQLQSQAGRDRSKTAGKAGALNRSGQRGRPAGVRPGDPRRGLRLNLIETLRAAAPWQTIRRRGGTKIEIRSSDFRVSHLKQRSETTTIFVVDASGSAALTRLAEAKGAVELLLAECYVRRDRVAVLAFRGRAAQVLLPPTRSLVRAKRSLAGLPGGGGTPLAAGIDAGSAMAADVRRRGGTPTVVLLTDGRANVARDGRGNRARAEEEALAAARNLREVGARVLLVDTSPRPSVANERLAVQMGARYLPLPYADAATLSRTVQAAQR